MDMIFTGLPGLPPPGTEIVTDGLGSAPGGVANIAVAMSKLGLRVGLAAPFGDDMFGAYLWRTLAEQEGVDLGLSRRVRGWSTPVTVSMAYDSDRAMVTFAKPVPSPPDDLGAPPPRAGLLRRRRPPGTAVGGGDARAGRGGVRRPRLGPDRRLVGRGPRPARARGRVPAERRRGDGLHPDRHPADAAEALVGRVPVVVVKRGGDGAIAIDSRTGSGPRSARCRWRPRPDRRGRRVRRRVRVRHAREASRSPSGSGSRTCAPGCRCGTAAARSARRAGARSPRSASRGGVRGGAGRVRVRDPVHPGRGGRLARPRRAHPAHRAVTGC